MFIGRNEQHLMVHSDIIANMMIDHPFICACIFKKDDEHDFNKYRPISLLPSISKVFEKSIGSVSHCKFTIAC